MYDTLNTQHSTLISEYFSDKECSIKTKSFTSKKEAYNRNSDVPFVLLDWDVPVNDLLDDIKLIKQYYPQRAGYKHHKWSAVTLYGYGEDKTKSHWEYLGLKSKKGKTKTAQAMKKMFEWVETLPFDRIDDIRILKLSAGGYVYPHIDVKEQSWLEPVSIALNWPSGCFFKFKNFGYVPFTPGQAVVLNVYYEHAVVNFSNECRYQLVIHGKKGSNFWGSVL